MPRLPIDYSKTIIYKIVCNDLNITDVYVGSTTDFIRRKGEHKRKSNNESSKAYNFKVYQTIRDNGGWDNFTMVEIEKCPCNDSNEAHARERYYYELLNAKLNIKYPNRTINEYRKDNKDKIKEERKQYYKNNKEKFKEYSEINKQKINEQRKQYNEVNKEKINEKAKQYRENNRDKLNEKAKQYREAKKNKN
jgi:hypothetical protein